MDELFEKLKYVSATRQRADVLARTDAPLGPSPASFVSNPALAAGYSVLAILGISDRPFTVSVEEACFPDGPFTVTSALSSALDASTGLQAVCQRVVPCGRYVRFTLANASASPQGALDFCASGIPV